MSADVQVVEIGDDNSLVPNLTISVDNEEEEDEASVPDIEYENPEENYDKKVDENTATIKPRLNLFPRKKIYENKTFGGAAELGLSFEEAEANRKKRAQRFQSPLVRTEEVPENNDQLLARSTPYTDKIAAYNKDLSAEDDKFIRLDTIHMMGVNSMSTEDIFAYFGKTNPRHIEWVNDNSCNVVWTEQELCAIAMEKVAHFHDHAEAKKATVKETESTSIEEDEDDLDLDDMEMDVEESTNTIETSSQPSPDVPLNPLRKCQESFVKNKQNSHLEVRYAVVGDRKELSASKKSKYYMKHGNPHFGGTKGLLTSTYRKKYHMKSAMRELRGLNVPTSQEYHDKYYENNKGKGVSSKRMRRSNEEYKSKKERDDDSLMHSTVKDLHSDESDDDDSDEEYGSMVADQVAERVKAAREKSSTGYSSTTSNNSVQSRLGKRSYEESHRSRNSPDGSVLNRLPKDLRSRLGAKRNNSPPTNRDVRSDRRERDERRGFQKGDSPLKQSHVKESSRELRSYSPPPWE